MLKEKYGDPLVIFGGKVKLLNKRYFSYLINRSFNLKYYRHEKSFYLYCADTGVWESISQDKLCKLLMDFLYNWLNEGDFDQEINTSRLVTLSVTKKIITLLKGICEVDASQVDYPDYFFHAKNKMLECDKNSMSWKGQAFSPSYNSQYQSAIEYDPERLNPEKFLDLLIRPAMTDDDIEVLQMYLGQCLLGKNLSQTFLLLEGTPGGGKSTLVNIIEKVIGKHHCAELRASLTTGRFEMGSLRGKRLLTGKDVSSEYMNNAGARALKVLTGNDSVTAEYKNSNKRDNFAGCFNIIITSNNTIKIKFDGDLEAWRRRILIIKYDNKPTEKKIANFDDVLIEEEGPDILNWMMDGASKLLRNGSAITKTSEQKRKVDEFLQSSDPFTHYAKRYIHRTQGAAVTTAEVVEQFNQFCHVKGWDALSEREIQKQLKAFMANKFGASITHGILRNGKSKRGYRGFQIRAADKK